MSKVLWIGDGGAHTGFGEVTHAITDRLVDKGHDVHILAANWRGDYWPSKAKMYPANIGRGQPEQDVVGFARILEMLGKVQPEVVFALNDPHVVMKLLFDNRFDPEYGLFRGVKFSAEGMTYKPAMIAYMPVDGYDLPRSWDMVATRAHRMTMSHFGSRAWPDATVVWHGVDTSLYHPRNRAEAKRTMGYDPDRFLILRVDKNSMRKDYPATWKAIRPLMRKYPDIDLHFHCLPDAFDGYSLRSVMFNDEDIRDRVNFSANLGGHEGWSDEALATMYAAADLFVSTSWAEGFGLGLLKSIASGTPVVAQDCSAITEVVGPGGVLVPPMGRISTPMGQDQCLPDIPAFTAAIERLYLGRGSRRKMGEAGVKHAQQFTWDAAADIVDTQIRLSLEPVAQPEMASIPG
jgi:glycosyltransferase involved in cell wall biosynthesis